MIPHVDCGDLDAHDAHEWTSDAGELLWCDVEETARNAS